MGATWTKQPWWNLQNFNLLRIMALIGGGGGGGGGQGGFLHFRDMKKFLKILLFSNGWSDFEVCTYDAPWINFTEMFLGWPFSKFVREILICQETRLWQMVDTCTIWSYSFNLIVCTCIWFCCLTYVFNHYQSFALLQEIVLGWYIPKFICGILIHQNHCCDCRGSGRFRNGFYRWPSQNC